MYLCSPLKGAPSPDDKRGKWVDRCDGYTADDMEGEWRTIDGRRRLTFSPPVEGH